MPGARPCTGQGSGRYSRSSSPGERQPAPPQHPGPRPPPPGLRLSGRSSREAPTANGRTGPGSSPPAFPGQVLSAGSWILSPRGLQLGPAGAGWVRSPACGGLGRCAEGGRGADGSNYGRAARPRPRPEDPLRRLAGAWGALRRPASQGEGMSATWGLASPGTGAGKFPWEQSPSRSCFRPAPPKAPA